MSLEGQVIEAVDAPEHYFQHAEFEDAGDGIVRVMRYIKRRGILIPVVNTVSSALSIYRMGIEAAEFAGKIMRGTGRQH